MTILRKFVHILLSVVLLATSISTSAAADGFMFRYRYSYMKDQTAPTPDTFGAGNDIVAYYVAPIGYDFEKKIPVATQDVVEWRMDSGRLPEGIEVDASKGILDGQARTEEHPSSLLYGYDLQGHRIARAVVNFTTFQPVGVPVALDLYAHTGTYFYSAIPDPDQITVQRWEPITAFAGGMSMMDQALQGVPEKSGTWGVALRGYDYMGKEVAFAYGDLLVEDGPVIEEVVGSTFRRDFGSQAANKDRREGFSVQATVRRSLGQVTYKLIPAAERPGGIEFSSAQGKLTGVFDDYETSARFQIEARDSYDGSTGRSNVFTLETLPQEIDLANFPDLVGYVKRDFYRAITKAGLPSDAEWSVLQGQLPAGIELNKSTGVLSGTPTKGEIQTDIVIGVSGSGLISAQSDPFTFTVHAERPVVTSVPKHVRTNTPFSTDPLTVGNSTTPYTVTADTLPSGITIDSSTGSATSSTGFADPGTYDFRMTVDNGRTDSVWQVLRAYNPLDVAYPEMKPILHEWFSFYPVVTENSTIDGDEFSIIDVNGAPVPSWLNFTKENGRIYGRIDDTSAANKTYGPYVVTRTDKQDSIPSEPFTISVSDRLPVELSMTSNDVQRYVANGYRIALARNARNGITYSVVSYPANWPATLRVTDYGWLVGSTTDPVGTTYDGLVIKAVDGEGSEDTSEPISLTVKEPSPLAPLSLPSASALEWTRDIAYAGTLPALANGYGSILYSLTASPPEMQLVDPSSGAFSFNFPASGEYAASYSADDDTERAPATGELRIKINDPVTTDADPSYDLHRGTPATVTAPAISGGTKPYSYTLTGNTPPGMSFSGGVLSGTPSLEGSYPLSVTVTDIAGSSDSETFTINVGEPLAIKLSYESLTLPVGREGSINPVVFNSAGTVTYQILSPLTTGGLPFPPPGLDFSPVTGIFSGVPTSAGFYEGYSVRAIDASGQSDFGPFDIVVTPVGDIVFVDRTERYRKDAAIATLLQAENAVAPVNYRITSETPFPNELILNPLTGSISGTISEVGTYSFEITAKDRMDREGAALVSYEILDDMIVEADNVELTQYSPADGQSYVSVTNNIGAPTFSLASGVLPATLSVDPATGAIKGTPEEAGTYAGLVIEVTDTDGQKRQTNEFSVTVTPRAPMDLAALAELRLKRYESVNFVPTTANAIGPVAFSITPDLPEGLTLEANGTITGQSDDLVAETGYTLTATDSKGGTDGTDTAQFTLSVSERDALAVTMADISGKQYVKMTPSAPGTSNGIGTVVYSITPDLPSGLVFDEASGTISGTPDLASPAATHTLTATDEKGGPTGTSSADFQIDIAPRDELRIDGDTSHVFTQFVAGEFQSDPINVIGEAAFSISPDLPSYLHLDAASGVISGTPSETMAPTTYTLTLADDHDSIDKTITLSVGERLPLEFVTGSEQAVLLGHEYKLTLQMQNVYGGAATYQVLSGTLPADISFDPATGVFYGISTEFGVTSTVTIRATDGAGDTEDRDFIFTVIQDGTPITSAPVEYTTRVGQPFTIPAINATNTVGDVLWSISDAPPGVSISPNTGVITGVMNEVGDATFTVNVKDVTDRDGSTSVRVVSVPAITVDVASTVPMTFNRDVPAEAGASASNAVGSVAWSVSGTLPSGVVLDAATGKFVGKPQQVGTFGPIRVTASDTLPGSTTSQAFSIVVAMNGDPIELSVTDYTTKVGQSVQTALPVYGNNLGPVTFFSTDLSGTGLTIDPATGVLSGTAQALADATINVSVRDRDTARVTSRPLRYRVVPNMQVSLPSQVTISALSEITPVAPGRNYVVGSSIWEPIDESVNKLPEGIVFDVATGTLRGTATEIGTFGPFTVSSVDSLGDRGVSNSFVVQSNPGAFFIGLASADLPDATKRIEAYSYDFKQNLTYVGMDESEITWTLGAGSPPGLTLANGVLSGTPTLSGTYTFDVMASYDAVTAKRSYTVNVNLPAIELTLDGQDLGEAKRKRSDVDNSVAHDLKTLTGLRNIPAENVTYAIEPVDAAVGEAFPTGLTLSADGVISGAATDVEGDYSFRVTATFKDATDENISATAEYTIRVVEEIKFEFGSTSLPTAYKRLAYSFDLAGLIDPSSIEGVAQNQITWSWAVDPAVTAAAPFNTVPEGLKLEGTSLAGTPKNSGSYALILTASHDGRTRSKAFTLLSELQQIAMSFKHDALPNAIRGTAYSFDLASVLETQNINRGDIITFKTSTVTAGAGEISGVPSGITISQQGIISGTPQNPGTYSFEVESRWNDSNATAESLTASRTVLITVTADTARFTDITVGGTHACGITETGALKCWGNNAYGQLGVGSDVYKTYTPMQVSGMESGVTEVSTSGNTTCAIQNGAAKCWGYNIYGQVGNGQVGADTNAFLPQQVPGLESNVTTIGVATYHACAALSTGNAKCWGLNNQGQLGGGYYSPNPMYETTPVPVVGLTAVTEIDPADGFTCALDGGAAKCWGRNPQGQLGTGAASPRILSPTLVTGLNAPREIAASDAQACAVDSEGVKCWGAYASGTSGTQPRLAPTLIPGLSSGVTDIAVSENYSACAVQNGSAKCWGINDKGQLGDGTTSYTVTTVPGQVSGQTSGVLQISAGTQNSCLVRTDHSAFCWGNNTYGQLGIGSTGTKLVPTPVLE